MTPHTHMQLGFSCISKQRKFFLEHFYRHGRILKLSCFPYLFTVTLLSCSFCFVCSQMLLTTILFHRAIILTYISSMEKGHLHLAILYEGIWLWGITGGGANFISKLLIKLAPPPVIPHDQIPSYKIARWRCPFSIELIYVNIIALWNRMIHPSR